MNLIQKLSPAYLPDALGDPYSLQALHERILQTILLLGSGFGLPLVVIASVNAITNHEYYLPLIYTLVYLGVAAVTVIRSLPYQFRGQVLTFLVFFLALSELFESGQIGEVRMFLLAFVALTAAFFNYRHIILSILLSLAVIIGTSLYASLASNPIIPALSHIREGTAWPISSLTFLMLSSVISGAFTLLIEGLDTNLKKQAALSESLAHERDRLEERINERTQGLQRRIVQQRTAAEISKTISAINDTNTLLQQVADLIKERFELYYVGIFMIDPVHQAAILQAGTGEAGEKMRSVGHRLALTSNSMIGWCITNRKPRIALDVGKEAVRFNNPYLPLTRSEMALPLIAYDRVLGAVSIQSDQPNAFDENDITVLESVTNSLAIALENARLQTEIQHNLVEINSLNNEYVQQAWAETIATNGQLAYEYTNPFPAGTDTLSHTLQVPLMLRNVIIGQIEIDINRPMLTENERAFVEQISGQTALALENARLQADIERRAIQEQKLDELTRRFSRAVSIDEILRSAAEEFGQLPTVSDVAVHLNPQAQAGLTDHPNGKERA